MKKTVILFFAAFMASGFLNLWAQPTKALQNIRNELFYTNFNFDKCFDYYNRIVNINKKSPLIQAYQAAAQSLMAKHTWNPINKINYLKHAQELLNHAVNADKTNPEIRFLRLYIQRSIPSYMGMSKDINEDKSVILANLDQLSIEDLGEDIAAYIAMYMASPDLTTQPEASLIKQKLDVR